MGRIYLNSEEIVVPESKAPYQPLFQPHKFCSSFKNNNNNLEQVWT